VTAALALFAGTAFAGGPPIVKEMDHPVDVTETFVSPDPCTGTPAEISLVQSGVEHVTFLADGTAHFAETLRGTFAFRNVDDEGNAIGDPYATGSVVSTTSLNGIVDLTTMQPVGKTEITDTLTGGGTRTDGTSFRFHNNEHILLTGTPPSPKLDFFKAHCG
jgi:hypothetical protein